MFVPVYNDTPHDPVVKSSSWRPGFQNDPLTCFCHITLNFPTTNRLERPEKLPTSVKSSPCYKLLKPYILCMETFGLFFVDESGTESSNGINKMRLFCRLGMLIQLSSTLFYALPFLLTFEFESFTVVMLVTCLWTLQNGFSAAIAHNMCTQKHKFQRFFSNWSELIVCPVERMAIDNYVRKQRNIILTLCWIFNIVFSVGWIATMSGAIAEPLPGSFIETVSPEMISFMKILFCATHFFGTVAWTLPTGLFVLICLTIRRLMVSYNTIISKSVDYILYSGLPEETPDPFKSEAFRMKHQKVLRLVETTNSMFGLFILTMLLTNLAILCFASYMLLFVCSTPFTKLLEAVWTFISTVWLLVLAIVGAMLHSAAHKPYDDLHAVPLNNMATDNIVKLLVFLNRVGGPEIGISAWGFSVLSKNFLSTLASMFLSYFFLLVQFQSPSGLSSCVQNATELASY